MPRITVKLASSYENISRPVAMGLARDVMKLCDIDESVPVYMPGEFDVVNQPGQAMGENGEPRFESNQRILVVAEDSLRNESVLNQAVRQNDLPAILDDPRLGISVRPVYMQSDITLSFRYICSTRQQAIKWRDEFAARRAENRTSISHQISYDIPIQDGVLALLAHLHSLREKIGGYGEDFVEYFQSMQRRQISGLGTRDGDINKLLINVPEKQAEITGWFDFTEIPKEVKQDGNVTWEIQFTYRTMYHRCTHLYIVYPLMIHQSHISRDYYSNRPRFAVEELEKNGAIGVTAFDVMDGEYESLMPPPKDGIRVPMYDEWIPAPRSQPPYSVPGISWMIQLDPKDPGDLLNLTQLPDLRLTLEMDTYLKTIHSTLHRKGGGLCFLTLYSGDMPLDEAMLTVDKDLNVRATTALDLRKQYHLRLSFPTLYSLFSKPVIRLMQEQWKATLQVFQSILPSLDVDYAKSILLADKYLPETYIAWFYKWLQDHSVGYPGDTGGPGGPINTGDGEGGALPGGMDDGPGKDGSWTDNIWKRRGMNGMRTVQFLAIVHLKKKAA